MATAVEPPHDPTKEARRREARGWLLGALGVLIFAFSIPMTRLASGPATDAQLPAAFVAIGRAAVAGLLALGWLAWRRSPLPARQHWPALAITAAGVVFGWPLCLGYAVLHVDAIHASVVTGVLPIATAGVAALLLRQRASAAFWACALVGTVLVMGYAAWKGGARLQAADALLLAAVFSAAVGYVQGARLSVPAAPGKQPPLEPEQVISWVLVFSLPLTLPWAWHTFPTVPVRPSAWLGFGYVAVFSMWLGFFAWYRGLALGGALRVSQVQLLQPFLSMMLAVPLLGESLDAATVAFALAVLLTVAVSRRLGAVAPRAPSAGASS